MIKLVKNELYKIFHKKMIYILLLVAVGIFGLSMVLENGFNLSTIDDLATPMYEQQLNQLDLKNEEDQKMYVELKSTIDVVNKNKELKLDYYSPEYYYFSDVYRDVVEEYYTAKIIDKDEEKINTAKAKLDEADNFIKNFDWKKYVQTNIDTYKLSLQGEMAEYERDVINETIKVLQYRLDNNIPLSYGQGSLDLQEYLSAYEQYSRMNKDDKTYLNRNELLQKKTLEQSVEEGKYKLEHKLFKAYKSYTTAQSLFLSVFQSVSLFINVCILMIGGSIVAEEYNKGTIKQLLTRPFTRCKILVSKMIATFIAVVSFMIILSLVYTLIGGIITNSFGTLLDPIVHYNLSTHSIVINNTLTEALLNLASILPCIIILILFTILVSVLTGNTAISVVLGFVLLFGPQLFSSFVDRVKLLSYLPMYNWDLSSFLYGGLGISKYLTLPKAIIIDAITIIGLIIINVIVFNKKDIKNQ